MSAVMAGDLPGMTPAPAPTGLAGFLPRTMLGRTALVMLVTVILTQVATTLMFQRFLMGPNAGQLMVIATNHMRTIAAALESLPADRREAFLGHFADSEGIRVIESTGAENPGHVVTGAHMLELRQRIRTHVNPAAELYEQDDTTPHSLWLKLPLRTGDFWVVIQRMRVDRTFPWDWVLLLSLGVGFAFAGAYLAVRRINDPIQALTAAVGSIGQGEHPPPVEEKAGPQEIRELSRAFNRMKDNLRELENDRMVLLAGVSHDLRTPLARLRLGVEMMDDTDPAARDGMVQDIADMDLIINQFLDFARDGRHEAMDPGEPGDLNTLVRECCQRALHRGQMIAMELNDVPTVRLKRPAADRLLNNLLENALRYAPGDIQVRTESRGDRVRLSVLDRGPGIPPAEVPRLLKPFTRLDAARSGQSGSGLGLAIVDRIARLHGAQLSISPRAGGGLEVSVDLPLAA